MGGTHKEGICKGGGAIQENSVELGIFRGTLQNKGKRQKSSSGEREVGSART